MIALAVGVPVLAGPAGDWNFWPLLGIPLAMVIVFRWWHVGISLSSLIGATLAGLVSADAVDAWGVIPVVLGATCLGVLGSVLRGQVRRNEPPTV